MGALGSALFSVEVAQAEPNRGAASRAELNGGAAPRAEPRWQVRVECAELSEENRAEIEVRHLAELQALRATPQVLVLRCDAHSVLGGWEREGKLASQKLVTRAPGDDLLELHHWLASMLAGSGPDAGEAGGGEASGGGAAAVALGPSVAAEHLPPAASSEVSASSPESSAAPRAAPPPSSSPQVSESPSSPGPSPTKSQASPERWRAGLGATYAYWGTQLSGSLGLTLEGSFVFRAPFAVHAAASYGWSLGHAGGFGAREGVFGVHLEVNVLRWFALLAGPVLSVAQLYGASEDTKATRDAVTAGGELLVRAVFPKRGPGGFIALGVRGLVSERQVLLNGEERLTIPPIQGVFVLGAQWGG